MTSQPYSGICIAPPYNATNFTENPILSTLQGYANNSPNYPWKTGTDAQQIYLSRQNISYFNGLNQQGAKQFKSEAERLMYIQGRSLTAARNKITGNNPSAPMGVPCANLY